MPGSYAIFNRTRNGESGPITSGLLVILEELKKSLLNNSFFGEASDATSCIPMI